MSKKIKKHSRTLKVYTHYSPRRQGKDCPVPYIRLRGKWLYEAGFHSGKQIYVIVGKKRVILISK